MTFETAEDRANEEALAREIERRSKGAIQVVKRPGEMNPVDWNILRRGIISSVGEIKVRTHSLDQYPTLWLSARKWISLWEESVKLEVPLSHLEVTGRKPREGSTHDVELMIHIPVNKLEALDECDT